MLALASTGARAQSVGGALSDPKKCVVIIDGMGDVGFRISDSQVVANEVITAMRKRVGFDGATYAGTAESAAALKKMLATPEGGGPQEAQLAWFKTCSDNAPWRVHARFGTTKKKKGSQPHWITVSCRKREADPNDPKAVVEEKKIEAKTFLEARDALVAALPAFCGAIPSVGMIPIEPAGTIGANGVTPEIPGMAKKKEPKPWTPPPRR